MTPHILRALFVGSMESVPILIEGSRGGQSELRMKNEKFCFVSI